MLEEDAYKKKGTLLLTVERKTLLKPTKLLFTYFSVSLSGSLTPAWAAKFITLYIQEYVGNWVPARVSCNIYSGNMLMREHSNLPHSDPFYGIWNLWMNKKCLGGTAFWSYKNKLHVNELSEDEYNHLFDKPLNGSGYETWRNFRGNEDWKMTCIAPMEYNTLLFYNGGFFHSPWIQESWYLDEYRYSMVGMGDFENV